MEGSNFAQFLSRLEDSGSSITQSLLSSSTALSNMLSLVIESKLYGIRARSLSKRSANLEVIKALATAPSR